MSFSQLGEEAFFTNLFNNKKAIPLERYVPTVSFVLEYLTKNNVGKGLC